MSRGRNFGGRRRRVAVDAAENGSVGCAGFEPAFSRLKGGRVAPFLQQPLAPGTDPRARRRELPTFSRSVLASADARRLRMGLRSTGRGAGGNRTRVPLELRVRLFRAVEPRSPSMRSTGCSPPPRLAVPIGPVRGCVSFVITSDDTPSRPASQGRRLSIAFASSEREG